MPFLKETEPARGVALPVLPGIKRIVARNPSVMTYQGTNTYLIAAPDGLTILDPGPNDAQHVADILANAGETPIRRILLTHTHSDHWGASAALAQATNLPIHAYKTSAKPGFTPDIPLDDGDAVAGLKAVFTPGHAADHLCYEYITEAGQKILFSGDHVMSWSSSIVSPPDGDMLAYYRSLELLLGRDEALYLGGHGPVLPEPRTLVRELLSHRKHRESTILAQLAEQDWAVAALSAKLYAKTDPFLKVAAQRNVLAHLLKLKAEGLVEEHAPDTELHPDARGLSAPPGEVKTESGAERTVMQTDSLRRFGLVG
jgi:glyoxylase-like metal-dependent hydrolase (beta-lactamase superfamily II)